MFEDKPPFHYRCKNCGYFFTTDKKLNVPSELSFISLDSKEAEKDENGNIIVKIDSKKESFIQKILKKLSPKCPKCKEHAVVSAEYMVHK
ncbi:hypothetical protein [Brachyspira hyodysenteriae]|uniref:hypothetical protein n=1 Tax=Brachyspira hyodysenteriae TaxID=159 RepID=UPI001ADDD3F0|nr:hypothetical protein [Brachyspira hyodysenteriae]MDA0080002.1 hypothetical protein [Brachyspira hyodysenteriae]QTM07974.1 hypothetical protein GQX60_03550 [Brachyspira hyodysenteriae]